MLKSNDRKPLTRLVNRCINVCMLKRPSYAFEVCAQCEMDKKERKKEKINIENRFGMVFNLF